MADPSDTETRAKLERALVLLEQRRAELLARFPVAPPTAIDGLGPAGVLDSSEFEVLDSDEGHGGAFIEASYVLAGSRARVAVIEFLVRDIATWCDHGAYPCYRVFVDAISSGPPLVLRRDGVEVGLGPEEVDAINDPESELAARVSTKSVGLEVEIA